MIGEIAVVHQVDASTRELVAKSVHEIEAQGLRSRVGPAATAVEGELRLQLEPHAETLEHQLEGITTGIGA